MKRIGVFTLTAAMALAAFSGSIVLREARAGDQAAASKSKAQFKQEWTYAENAEQWAKLQKNIGKPAPALTIGPWIGEEPKPISDMKGKIVVVDFWATWCGPCKRAIPHMNEIMAKYKDKGVEVIAVCCTREGKGGAMADVAKDLNMKYPTAQDKNNKSAEAWGVAWWPFVIIIDREGTVRMAGLTVDSLDDALDALLAEQPAS